MIQTVTLLFLLHHKRILWLILSKAFSKSQKMPPTMSLLFKAVRISLITLYMALFIDVHTSALIRD